MKEMERHGKKIPEPPRILVAWPTHLTRFAGHHSSLYRLRKEGWFYLIFVTICAVSLVASSFVLHTLFAPLSDFVLYTSFDSFWALSTSFSQQRSAVRVCIE